MKIAKCTEDKKYVTSTGKGDNLLSNEDRKDLLSTEDSKYIPSIIGKGNYALSNEDSKDVLST